MYLKRCIPILSFLVSTASTPKLGLTAPNLFEARVNRAMVDAAEKVVAVCDSRKFNRRSLSLIVGAAAIDHVITDSNLAAEEVKAIRDAGIEVTIV